MKLPHPAPRRSPGRLPATGLALALLAAAPAPAAPPGTAAPLMAIVPADAGPLRTPASDYFPGASEWRGLGLCGFTIGRVRVLNPAPVVGEPLILDFHYWVPPTAPEDEVFPISPAGTFGRDLLVQVRPPNGLPFTYVPRPLGQVPAGGREGQLLRGQSLAVRVPAAYDPDSTSYALLESPGPHQLRVQVACGARLSGTGQPAASPPALLEVNVRPAQGDDLVAWNILAGTGAYDSIHSLSVRDPAHAALLERVVKEAPGAAVRPFCIAALANYSRNLPDLPEEQRAQMTLTFCQLLLRDYPRHVLSRTALALMLSTQERLGLEELAWDTFRTLWNDPFLQEGLRVSTRAVAAYAPPTAMDNLAAQTASPTDTDWTLHP